MKYNTQNKEIKFTKTDEQILQQWKHINGLSERTYHKYKVIIQHYIRTTNMTITELYEEAIKEEHQHIPKHRKKIKMHMINYYEYLENSELSENTKSLYVNVVKSFYNSFDVNLPKIRNNYNTNPDPENTEKAITKEIIQIMMNQASTKEKAILSFSAMTGQSPDEIRRLTIEQFMAAWSTKLETPLLDIPDIFKYKNEIIALDVVPLRMIRHKTRTKYWVYVPRETTQHILSYLYERVAGQNTKIRIHSKKDYLFVTNQGKFYGDSGIGKIFNELGRKCGFESPELFPKEIQFLLLREQGKHRTWSAYKFRKYFLNTCRRYAGTTPDSPTRHMYTGEELGDFWIGHQKKGSISHYLQYTEEDVEELEAHFLQMLPFLSLEMKVDVVTSEDKLELNMLKEQYNSLIEEMDELREYVRQRDKMHTLAREYGLE